MMNLKVGILLAVSLFAVCSADSCSNNRCGTFDLNAYDCQCNGECIYHGNCCSDYSTLCDPDATCSGRTCYNGHDTGKPCQCNDYCVQYKDCCPDFPAACDGSNVVESCAGRCGPGTDTGASCQCNSYCLKYGDCCSDYSELCESGGGGTSTTNPGSGTSCSSVSVSDSEIVAVSYNLWSMDVNAAGPNDVTYDLQSSTTTGATNDAAPGPFFTYVNEAVFQRTTFQKLRAIQDNYIRKQGFTEDVTAQEEQENSDFLDAVLSTEIGQYLYEFLDSKNLAGCNGIEGFKQLLNVIWFGMYDRSAPDDTSGFEHSFVGEIKGSKVSGFHNWMYFYYEEQYGNFNYQGYISQQEPNMVGMRHTWYEAPKSMNGFTIGTSPEIELALYTLCYLTRPGSLCTINLSDEFGEAVERKIQTWTWGGEQAQGYPKYIASAYFLT
ncbi:uridylate-specific endoribonuclease A-like [Styela clava]